MAEAGLFIGWGEPVTGREAKGLEVFAEALAYYGKAEQEAASRATRPCCSTPMVVSCRALSWSAGARRRSPSWARRTSSSGSLRELRSSCGT
jgi:hypothetical protein